MKQYGSVHYKTRVISHANNTLNLYHIPSTSQINIPSAYLSPRNRNSRASYWRHSPTHQSCKHTQSLRHISHNHLHQNTLPILSQRKGTAAPLIDNTAITSVMQYISNLHHAHPITSPSIIHSPYISTRNRNGHARYWWHTKPSLSPTNSYSNSYPIHSFSFHTPYVSTWKS